MPAYKIKVNNLLHYQEKLLDYGYEFQEGNILCLASSADLMSLAVCINEISKVPFPFDYLSEEVQEDGTILITMSPETV